MKRSSGEGDPRDTGARVVEEEWEELRKSIHSAKFRVVCVIRVIRVIRVIHEMLGSGVAF